MSGNKPPIEPTKPGFDKEDNAGRDFRRHGKRQIEDTITLGRPVGIIVLLAS
jgi:hypothetical protein